MPRRAASSRYTPRNRAELVACLVAFDDEHLVEVKPSAAKLLQPHEIRTVKDTLDLQVWPYSRLSILIEQRPAQAIAVVIEPVLGAPDLSTQPDGLG
jgi:hypothetical protein